MAYNKYKRYKISRSLNGIKIVFLARAVGKRKSVIGRANTEKELIKQMKEGAKRVEAEILAVAEAREARVKKAEEKTKKKLGLWKAGGAVSKKKIASASSKAGKSSKSTAKSGSAKIEVIEENLG
jgi:hypothetical protein